MVSYTSRAPRPVTSRAPRPVLFVDSGQENFRFVGCNGRVSLLTRAVYAKSSSLLDRLVLMFPQNVRLPGLLQGHPKIEYLLESILKFLTISLTKLTSHGSSACLRDLEGSQYPC